MDKADLIRDGIDSSKPENESIRREPRILRVYYGKGLRGNIPQEKDGQEGGVTVGIS